MASATRATLSPEDPSETSDRDGDGIGVKADEFPDDASYLGSPCKEKDPDTDGDGVRDRDDAFPEDPSETSDRDGDGVDDKADEFPDDASCLKSPCKEKDPDTDGDGVRDKDGALPEGPSESSDRDGDGISDKADEFPDDASCLKSPCKESLHIWMFFDFFDMVAEPVGSATGVFSRSRLVPLPRSTWLPPGGG